MMEGRTRSEASSRSGAQARVAASSPDALRRMQSQAQADTRPEKLLRSVLHARGLRFLVNRQPIPGVRRKADIVFPRARVAVFVDGCFWHVCPHHATWPRANAEFWKVKLRENQRRDRETDSRLQKAGWLPIRVWEHESPEEAAERIRGHVRTRTPLPT